MPSKMEWSIQISQRTSETDICIFNFNLQPLVQTVIFSSTWRNELVEKLVLGT